MTITRAHLVDPSVSSWYHCVTCCVRQAFLLGEGMQDRKSWNEHRLEELAEIFALAGVWFAILDNHLHLLVRLDPDVARYWSDEDVVRRWGFEPGCRRHRRDSRGQRPYLDQAAGRACQGRGTNRGPERRPSRQRRGLDCGGGPGGGAVALSSRGSTAAGFGTRRDDRRILAGQLTAPGGVHRAVVPRGHRPAGGLAGVCRRLTPWRVRSASTRAACHQPQWPLRALSQCASRKKIEIIENRQNKAD